MTGEKDTHEEKLHICMILDESGSMMESRDATISGVNEFLLDQKRSGNPATFTLTKFNTETMRVVTAQPIAEAEALSEKNYLPGGMTALHDAVARAIKAMENEVPVGERVLCAILTDGEENSSTEHSLKEVSKLIEAKTKTGLWTFTFLGANQDAWAVGHKMGIPVGNVANYVQSPVGVRSAFRAMSAGAMSLASSHEGQTSAYYGVKDIPEEDDSNAVPKGPAATSTGK